MVGVYSRHFRRALGQAFGHNAFTIAKAAAYSELLSLFPALLVGTRLLAMTPASESVRGDVVSMLRDLLPPDTMALAQHYFDTNPGHSQRLVITAGFVAVFAAVGVMLSLMEGFRRAYRLPRGEFGFWKERGVALALIPSTLLPMLFATAFVVFGHQIELWMVDNADHALRPLVLMLWRIVRWGLAMAASVGVLAVIYHFSTSLRPAWRQVLPGAVLATLGWFLSTILYGWYVTRFANYSIVYGPLGAGIATMVWLYIVSLAMLIGAEYNAQIYPLSAAAPDAPLAPMQAAPVAAYLSQPAQPS
ncbi:MAG TPA: YihY/virulence factor BrkB family protein [Acidobacteriaceae bacterium]